MPDTPEAGRWRNWLALALGMIVGLFSYFSYAAAFVEPEGGGETIVDGGLVAISLAIAPFVFVVIAVVSRNARGGKMVLLSMGLLIALGLFTRPAAFLASGTMAAAYFMGHAPQNFWPVNNMGDAAILYCFVFLYLVFAGPGRFSVDEALRGKANALRLSTASA